MFTKEEIQKDIEQMDFFSEIGSYEIRKKENLEISIDGLIKAVEEKNIHDVIFYRKCLRAML